MVRIWEMDPNPTGDLRLPQFKYPPKMITPDRLRAELGLRIWKVNMEDNYEKKKRLDSMFREYGFNSESHIILEQEQTRNFEDNMFSLKQMQEGREHVDPSARLVTSGSGYFDIRRDEEHWLRIAVTPGDLVIFPKNTFYRFSTDTKNSLSMLRYTTGGGIKA